MPKKRVCISCGEICYARNIPYTCKKCKLHTTEYRRAYKANWVRKKKYDIDEDQLDLLWAVFKGKCGICNNDLIMPIAARGQPLNAMAIDHSHVTGNLRGLLCNGCNKGLGLFKDNPEYLKNAIKWVQNGT